MNTMNGNGGRGYRHDARRKSNPSAEAAGRAKDSVKEGRAHRHETRTAEAKKVPTLNWDRKNKPETWGPMLATVERIEPDEWLDALRKDKKQSELGLGHNPDEYADADAALYGWYEHEGRWANRIIHGSAPRVMAGLLEHDCLAEQVQFVYFDPPYGMDYDAKFMHDTVQTEAFRDTYERGIHSYLDGVRETAVLAHELLAPTGSLFMQIGDVNIHRCAMVLDEVFGPENRVSTISYATGGGGSSTKEIAKAGDWILWYAKDRDQMYFQALYEEQDLRAWLNTQTFAAGVEIDNEIRALTTAERETPEPLLEAGGRFWRMGPLLSQGASDNEQGDPYEWNGIVFGGEGGGLENAHWRVDRLGLDALAETGRLFANVEPPKVGEAKKQAGANQLHMKLYQQEMAGKRLNNLWSETIAEKKKVYPVQTGRKAIERCMLMTTRPGDLALDPTLGSGTTAVVAETWGRRWIGIDSSRMSAAVSRERMLTTTYPRHLLANSEAGWRRENELRDENGQALLPRPPDGAGKDPKLAVAAPGDKETDRQGIVVERMPYVSAASLAYAEREDKQAKREVTWLVDRPVGARPGRRITSRFTVETELRTTRYEDPARLTKPRRRQREDEWRERALARLEEAGVETGGERWNVAELEAAPEHAEGAGRISHRAAVVGRVSGRRKTAAVAVFPEDVKVSASGLNRTVAELDRRTLAGAEPRVELLLIVGAEFASDAVAACTMLETDIALVEAKADLHLKDVSKGAQSSFVLLAQPSVLVERAGEGQWTAELKGWMVMDPVAGTPAFRLAKDVRLWLLDTDYDEGRFIARRIHAPRTGKEKEELHKDIARVLGREAHTGAVQAVTGLKSAPFDAPETGMVGVRVITVEGGEVWGSIEVGERKEEQ